MPVYKYNKSYSCIISAPPPLNGLLLLILPYFLLSKNETQIIKVNMLCMKILYIPVALICLIIFATLNLLILPLAFIKSLVHKLFIYYR